MNKQQKYICTFKGQWYRRVKKWESYLPSFIQERIARIQGPKYDEVVTVVAMTDRYYLYLKGYEQYGCYTPIYFRPINESECFAIEVLEKVKEQIEEEELVDVKN